MRAWLKVGVALWLVSSTAAVAAVGGQPEKVKQVAAGDLTAAQASWWGFDPADSTATLQAAIDSGVAKLTIDKLAHPWVTEPLKLRDDLELVFAEGVELLAKPGAFRGRNDSLLGITNGRNIILRGEGAGATLRMRRADYDAEPYDRAEWRMVIRIAGCDGLQIENLTLAESGGDGIYFGAGGPDQPCRNVVVRDVICDGNYRQGISVISARNVLLERVVMRNTDGTPPEAGIDWEPNNPTDEITDFVMRDCVVENNTGPGYIFSLYQLTAVSKPVSVTLENCVARGDHPMVFRVMTGNAPEAAVGGTIRAVNCTFEGGRLEAVAVMDVPAEDGLEVVLENCRIVNPLPTAPATPPILMASTNRTVRPIGHLTLDQVTVVDPLGRRPLGMLSWSPGIGVDQITGRIQRVTGDETVTYDLTPALLADWMPVVDLRRVPPFDMTDIQLEPAGQPGELAPPRACFRGLNMATVYATAGEEVKLTIQSVRIGKYATQPIRVTVQDEAGDEVAKGETRFDEEDPFSFIAPRTGTFEVAINPGAHAAVITAANVPAALDGRRQPLHLIGATGTYYVLVPKGVKSFGIGFYGESQGEGLKASVFDPAGQEVWAEDTITQPKIFVHDRADSVRAEVWAVKLEKPTGVAFEDYYLDLMGIPRLLAGSPAALLQPVDQAP